MAEIFSGALAPHAHTSPLIVALTQPLQVGVTVQVSAIQSTAMNTGLSVSFALSIDGGTTYGSTTFLFAQLGASNVDEVRTVPASVIGAADHVAFVLQNSDSTFPIANVVVTASAA